MNKKNVIPAGERPKIKKGTAKRLFKYVFKGNIVKFIVVTICIILSSLTSVAASLFLQVLIDDYITPLIGNINPDFSKLFHLITIMGGIFLAGIIANYIYNLLMTFISEGVLKKLRDEMFNKMQSLPIKYFDDNSTGDIMSRYTNDVDTLTGMIYQSIPQLMTSVITIVAVFSALLYLNVYLTLVVVAFIIVMLVIVTIISKRSSKFFIKQQNAIGGVNGYIEEMINGQKVIKVFCHEEKSKLDFDKLNDELYNSGMEANKTANVLMPILGNVGNLQYVVIAIVGGILAVNNLAGLSVATIGVIASFLQLSKSFVLTISRVSQQLNSIIMALAGAQRIFELLDVKPEEDDGIVTLVNVKEENGKYVETQEYTGNWAWKCPKENGSIEYKKLRGHVELNNVDFEYIKGKTILHNVSLYAKEGQKIAFVGATGAGKTTITNLLNRFYDIKKGKIIYDGIDIKLIKKADLRRSLGMVLQDVNLFTGTIKENIRYGNPGATDEQVYEAAKLANADGFINMLPDGYDTQLTENGTNLSQGQRQLISIARVAVNNPPVMILDEATSSIDTRTEKIVQDGMDKLMKGRTVFVIAHRLSTVRNSKAIIVLEHGRIIERGKHEDLIAQKGKYYQLYTGAFELE